MNSSYRFIIYVLIALLSAGTVLLFVFGEPALKSVMPETDLAGWAASIEVTAVAAPSEQVLKAPVLAALTDYSPNFDFDRVCWRPSAITSQPSAEDEEAIMPSACTKGNSLPFFIKKD